MLGVLVASGVLSMTLAAYQQPAPAPIVVEAEKIMDKNNGGSGVGYAGTLAKAAAAQAQSVDMIINGHNATTTTVADLRTQSEFIAEFVKFAQDAKKAGKTVDDVVATWKTPAKYTGYATPQPARIKSDAQVVFDETMQGLQVPSGLRASAAPHDPGLVTAGSAILESPNTLTRGALGSLDIMIRLRMARRLAALLVLAGGCSAGTPTDQNTTAPPAASPQAGVSLTALNPPAASPAIPTRTDSSGLPLAEIPAPSTSLPRPRTAEELMRAEVASWKDTPYRENGTSRSGIGNAGFVRAVYRGSFDADIPASYDQQIRTGKLVARGALVAGDLVFFEGRGLGPFRAKSVGIFIGAGQIAIANKDEGVAIARLSESKWDGMFKTARRMPVDPNAATPAFDAASYGSTSDLLRDVAEAWSGTLYRQGGATFDGIGNEEFVRSIFEAIYDTELEGGPRQWAAMGKAVRRNAGWSTPVDARGC